MNGHAASFIVNVWRRNGGEYEPGSLSLRGFFSSTDRHLRHHRYGETLVECEVFSEARDALKAKQIDLKTGEREPIKQRMSDEDVEELFRASQLGNHSSQAIINTRWLYNNVCFGMHGATEHRELRWGDIELKRNDAGCEFFQYNERQTKTRTGRCFFLIYIDIFAINDEFSIQLIFHIIVTLFLTVTTISLCKLSFARHDSIAVPCAKIFSNQFKRI